MGKNKMKIRIIKENKKRKDKLDEGFRDAALAAMLGLAGVSNSAEAGVSNVTEETLDIAHAFAKEKVQNSTDIDKTIEYNKALESLEIA
jgi:phosphoenolpyruvate synthase/pyruvate phosphate dikinase